VADACIRAGVPLRVAPPGICAVIPRQRIAGRALSARHYGSVDVFLEAFSGAADGDVLVVDNGGREVRRALAIWSCWRHKRRGSAGWWCGDGTAIRRN
jgi:4-hydroxy-4-methyl-2-oxoglutarate aldolase